MRKSVKVSTRETLKRMRLGRSYSETLAALAGRWRSRQIATESVASADKADAVVKVSEAVHSVLSDLRNSMDVDSLGYVVAVLIANWRR